MGCCVSKNVNNYGNDYAGNKYRVKRVNAEDKIYAKEFCEQFMTIASGAQDKCIWQLIHLTSKKKATLERLCPELMEAFQAALSSLKRNLCKSNEHMENINNELHRLQQTTKEKAEEYQCQKQSSSAVGIAGSLGALAALTGPLGLAVGAAGLAASTYSIYTSYDNDNKKNVWETEVTNTLRQLHDRLKNIAENTTEELQRMAQICFSILAAVVEMRQMFHGKALDKVDIMPKLPDMRNDVSNYLNGILQTTRSMESSLFAAATASNTVVATSVAQGSKVLKPLKIAGRACALISFAIEAKGFYDSLSPAEQQVLHAIRETSVQADTLDQFLRGGTAELGKINC